MTAVPPNFPPPPSSLAPPPTPSLPVQTPSGQVLFVLGAAEQNYYDTQSTKYRLEYQFTNVSDLADLDQLLFHELMIFRLSTWLGQDKDYDGNDVDLASTRRAIKESADLAGKVKAQLGMTKSQRDKEKAENVSVYLTTLQQRAKEFGIHREKQLGKALELMNDLFAKVGAFDRADEVERQKLEFPDEHSLLEWVRKEMRPQFEAVDNYFRQNQQRAWLKDL